MAIIDWHSRMILSWELSNGFDSDFCIHALDRAIAEYGKPEVLNTGQECQYIPELVKKLERPEEPTAEKKAA